VTSDIWATFSSRVNLDTRSLTRCSKLSEGFWNGYCVDVWAKQFVVKTMKAVNNDDLKDLQQAIVVFYVMS